jgi:hypothetical protein
VKLEPAAEVAVFTGFLRLESNAAQIDSRGKIRSTSDMELKRLLGARR